MKEIWIKKPLQKRSRAKFRAIVNAFPQVLREAGYARATTAKVALEADVSIGTLYNYFSCKDAVLFAFLDNHLNAALERVLQAVSNNQLEPREFVREFVCIGVDFAYEQREMIKIALQEFPERILNPDLSESREKVMQIIAKFNENKKFRLKEIDARIGAYTLTNIILGFQFRTVIMPDETLKRDDLVNELTGIIATYLFHS